MKITYSLLDEYIQKGVAILHEVYPSFQYLGFTSVKIGRSRTHWATIKKNLYTGACALNVSNCFNDIPDEHKAQTKLLSTIIHELIHTIPGCMNHGPNFKYYAGLVNGKYPALDIKRATSMEEFGVQEKEPTYVISCGICHKQWNYYRKPRYYGQLDKYVCPICHCSALFFSKVPGMKQGVCYVGKSVCRS